MRSLIFTTCLIFKAYAQIALPSFHSIQKPHTTTSSSDIDVLIIWDNSSTNSNTLSLKNALESEGFNVTLSTTNESAYNGSNPALTNFEAVIHLNGTTYGSQMPNSGQTALVDFVNIQGGLYCHTSWLPYQRGQSKYSTMSELIILSRSTGTTGSLTYSVASGQSSHAVLNGVPSSFTINTGADRGYAVSYSSNPVTVLMKEGSYDAVMIRSYGNGKIMGMSQAGNYANKSVLSDTNIQKLFINAINWAN